MGGLFSALQTASTALDVMSQALGVDQSNIANASTRGYVSQTANIQPIGTSGTGAGSNGGDFITRQFHGKRVHRRTRAEGFFASFGESDASRPACSHRSALRYHRCTGILAAFQQLLSRPPRRMSVSSRLTTALSNSALPMSKRLPPTTSRPCRLRSAAFAIRT
jgi:hypothetical protein